MATKKEYMKFDLIIDGERIRTVGDLARHYGVSTNTTVCRIRRYGLQYVLDRYAKGQFGRFAKDGEIFYTDKDGTIYYTLHSFCKAKGINRGTFTYSMNIHGKVYAFRHLLGLDIEAPSDNVNFEIYGSIEEGNLVVKFEDVVLDGIEEIGDYLGIEPRFLYRHIKRYTLLHLLRNRYDENKYLESLGFPFVIEGDYCNTMADLSRATGMSMVEMANHMAGKSVANLLDYYCCVGKGGEDVEVNGICCSCKEDFEDALCINNSVRSF